MTSAGTRGTPDHEPSSPAAEASTGSAWLRFGWGPWGADERVPQEEPDEETRARLHLPATLRPVPGGDTVVQRPVFDPAAVHHGKAMRLGEPEFADAETGERWYRARRRALDLMLAAVAGSEWADHLVLRGSVLLRGWYGEAAREPGDLDFVVVPSDWRLRDERTDRMLESLARAADLAARRSGDGVRLDSRRAVGDEIWTYERVPGRRLVVPWSAEGLPGGTVQLDFVFNEMLPVPAVRTVLPPLSGAGAPVTLLAATPELSLAWKVMWLATDRFPEGKDLHDALLLAESGSVRLSFELLRSVFQDVEDGWYDRNPVLPEHIAASVRETEWFEFAKEYPHLAGGRPGRSDGPPADHVDRLLAALAPTYRALDDDSGEGSRYLRIAAWMAPTVRQCRPLLAAAGPDALLDRLYSTYVHEEAAVVVTRELLGRAGCTLERAGDLVAGYRAAAPEHPSRTGWDADRVAGAVASLRGAPAGAAPSRPEAGTDGTDDAG
ncbi:nucleotidyl transferase AbiEii/AbiGii toxin family protein [Streptomyces sp. NPDC018031]|uniref:nucleotidyl transferase AbiEii/AbiGii toxin family protein n=1 Tax=Streptomyces sp. NPDC018031 TaxID=3365033 RepID=UPI00379DA956